MFSSDDEDEDEEEKGEEEEDGDEDEGDEDDEEWETCSMLILGNFGCFGSSTLVTVGGRMGATPLLPDEVS